MKKENEKFIRYQISTSEIGRNSSYLTEEIYNQFLSEMYISVISTIIPRNRFDAILEKADY